MKKKLLMTLTITLCAVALVVGSVVGTIAYLRSTAYVTNVFTYGKVLVTLDEAAIADDGFSLKSDLTERNSIGNKYKLLPGVTYTKDPIIHVDKDSEETYLFLRVENGLAEIEAETATVDSNGDGVATNKTVHDQLTENGWVLMNQDNETWGFDTYGNGTNIYCYMPSKLPGAPENTPDTVMPNDVDNIDVKTFDTFTIKTNLKLEDLTAYTSKSVVVVVYAVQAEGLPAVEKAANVFKQDFINPILTGSN